MLCSYLPLHNMTSQSEVIEQLKKSVTGKMLEII